MLSKLGEWLCFVMTQAVSAGNNQVYQSKFVVTNDKTYLVLATASGVQVRRRLVKQRSLGTRGGDLMASARANFFRQKWDQTTDIYRGYEDFKLDVKEVPSQLTGLGVGGIGTRFGMLMETTFCSTLPSPAETRCARWPSWLQMLANSYRTQAPNSAIWEVLWILQFASDWVMACADGL